MENMSYLAFSKSLAGFLTERAGYNHEKEVILTYIIELLVINMVNILFIVILATLLGVLPGTLSCLISAFLFRQTAGGAHSNSPWRCVAVSIAVYPTIALAANLLTKFGGAYVNILSVVAIMIGLIVIAILAPVDSPSAPIISPYRRRKLKILSLAVLTIIAAIIILLRWSDWAYALQVRVCLTLTVLWVSFMVSKPGHRLMSFIDKIKFKEVRIS